MGRSTSGGRPFCPPDERICPPMLPGKLHKHIERHMQHISLFVIHRQYDAAAQNDASEGSSNAAFNCDSKDPSDLDLEDHLLDFNRKYWTFPQLANLVVFCYRWQRLAGMTRMRERPHSDFRRRDLESGSSHSEDRQSYFRGYRHFPQLVSFVVLCDKWQRLVRVRERPHAEFLRTEVDEARAARQDLELLAGTELVRDVLFVMKSNVPKLRNSAFEEKFFYKWKKAVFHKRIEKMTTPSSNMAER